MSEEVPRTPQSQPRPLELTVRRSSRDASVSSLFRFTDQCLLLIKILAWPSLCLALFLYLRQPIIAVAAQVPRIISQSSKLSVGTLSFEIRERADATGDRELGLLIEGLSPAAIENLLKLGKEGWMPFMSSGADDRGEMYFFPTEEDIRALIELEEKKLLSWSVPRKDFVAMLDRVKTKLQPDEDCDSCGVRIFRPRRQLSEADHQQLFAETYRLSGTGVKARDLIIKAVVEQLEPKKGSHGARNVEDTSSKTN